MRFVTYNLRYDSQPDNITVRQSLERLPDPLLGPGYHRKRGEQPWSLRRMRVAEHLLGEGIVLAGFQEALVRQVHDLAELFGEDWGWVGVGRDDGKQAGEYSPVFYKKSELVLLSYDSFWTSNTPFIPSRFPGAGSHRVCTTVRLQRRAGGQKFTVLNTHMDDRSEAQRQHAASMLLARARYEAAVTGEPVFVLGDFNSPPTGRDSGAYEITTGVREPGVLPKDFAARYAVPDDASAALNTKSSRYGREDAVSLASEAQANAKQFAVDSQANSNTSDDIEANATSAADTNNTQNTSTNAAPFVLHDLRAHTPRRFVSANHATFTGFNAPDDTSVWSRIDFVFGGGGGWKSTAYKVATALSDDGVLASDHRPVFVDVVM
ncbi:Endonuclease/exonuclease/phosphatase [Mycena crocata]|nr:Endonuclease/exonuclease/phosphatase [Mycena crocata]